MTERWLGITVSGDDFIVVDAEVPASGPLTILADQTFAVPKGNRASAYRTVYQQMADYVAERGIAKAIVKESAISLRGTKKAHLLSAELRGVVMCACAAGCETTTASKAHVSRYFGERKSDDYVADDEFWPDQTSGKPLRKGSRETVLYMLAERSK